MTTITGITATELPRQGQKQPDLSRDFAHELAKRHAPSHDEAKASSDDEKVLFHVGNESSDLKPEALVELPRQAMADQICGVPANQFPIAIELQDRATVQPVGMTEALLGARVFGWHALAQSYLSELETFDITPDGAVRSMEEKVPSVQLEPRVARGANGAAMGVFEPPATQEALGVLPVAEPMSRIESDIDPVGANDPSLAATASADYWAERSLRFTRHPDGKVVAWLRDYRLDATRAGQVVRLVLQDARAKGFRLDRIILNGREAWSSRDQFCGGAP